MSYNDFELSVASGKPIECYKLIGSFRTYRYTSCDQQVIVNGETYDPVALKRGELQAGTQSDDTLTLEITLPFDAEAVLDYAYAASPPRLDCEIRRVHRDSSLGTDWVLMWKGKVTSFTIEGREAKLQVPSIFSRSLQGDIPACYWQSQCNFVLFDGRCKVVRASFANTATVLTYNDITLEVNDDGFDDAEMVAGEVVNNRTGERRLCLGNSVNVITVSFPFFDMQVGDTVTLYAGCDHSYTTCDTKFNNKVNFGGQPYINPDNPFVGSLN
jgi:uncharacterized phage protein (TIGR02218 family)